MPLGRNQHSNSLATRQQLRVRKHSVEIRFEILCAVELHFHWLSYGPLRPGRCDDRADRVDVRVSRLHDSHKRASEGRLECRAIERDEACDAVDRQMRT